MLQQVFTQARPVSLQHVQLENVQLQKCLAAQKSVINALERRAGRSLDAVGAHLTQLNESLDDSKGWQVALSQMQHEISGLCDLVADAMLLQKLEAGKVEIRLQPLDLAQLLDVVSRHLVEPHGSDAVQLNVQIEPQLPYVMADHELIEAVITDLLARSLKYSAPGSEAALSARSEQAGVIVQVTAQQFAPKGDRDFATEVALCCRQIEVQNGHVTCSHHPGGLQSVIITLPSASAE